MKSNLYKEITEESALFVICWSGQSKYDDKIFNYDISLFGGNLWRLFYSSDDDYQYFKNHSYTLKKGI